MAAQGHDVGQQPFVLESLKGARAKDQGKDWITALRVSGERRINGPVSRLLSGRSSPAFFPCGHLRCESGQKVLYLLFCMFQSSLSLFFQLIIFLKLKIKSSL